MNILESNAWLFRFKPVFKKLPYNKQLGLYINAVFLVIFGWGMGAGGVREEQVTRCEKARLLHRCQSNAICLFKVSGNSHAGTFD